MPPSMTKWHDMNALRRQFARHALGKAAQRELAHRERAPICEYPLTLADAPGEQNRAVLVGQHSCRGLLRHQKAAERADRDRLCDGGGHQIDEGSALPSAGVVDDHSLARPISRFDQPEQALDVIGLAGVAGKGARAGLGAERAELFDLACGQRDTNAFAANRRASDALRPRRRRRSGRSCISAFPWALSLK
jgi:hypothetical protein